MIDKDANATDNNTGEENSLLKNQITNIYKILSPIFVNIRPHNRYLTVL